MVRNQNIDLHPRVPEKSPPRIGPSAGGTRTPAWKTIYDVAVRFMSSAEMERSAAMLGMAGKYMLEAKPLNVAAIETLLTINALC